MLPNEKSFSRTTKSLPESPQLQIKEPHLIKRKSTPQEQLQEILTCHICYCLAKNLIMCPNCSKIYCQPCIKKSLVIKAECPHCRKNIKDIKSMANCQRFVNQMKSIVQEVIKEKEKDNFRCEEHDVPLNYFCIQCEKSVCCQCKMFGNHSQHDLVQIQKKYQQKYQKLRYMLAELKVCIREKEGYVNQIQKQLKQTQSHFDSEMTLINQLEQQYMKVIQGEQVKMKQISKINIQKLQNFLERLEQNKRQLKSEFSKRKKQSKFKIDDFLKHKIQNTLEECKTYDDSMGKQLFSYGSCIKQIVPPYVFNTFVIDNFSQRRKQDKCLIYSNPVQSLGCEWKLKIYPNGCSSVEGKFLSIYIFMVSKSDSNRSSVNTDNPLNVYEYLIEIVKPKENEGQSECFSSGKKDKSQPEDNFIFSDKNFSRQYSSAFEPGESWGYNKYIELSKLDQEKLVSNDDTLTIKYGIRRPDYFRQYKSLQHQIEDLQQQIETEENKLKVEIR